MHDLAADHRQQRPDGLDLACGDGEVVAIEHQQVGVSARRERTEIALLEQEIGVRARMRDQRFLAVMVECRTTSPPIISPVTASESV